MTILEISAFSDGQQGGNPAGVLIAKELPSVEDMQRIAAELGHSETVFSAQQDDGKWLTRYFSPESEVPFCGHATIALGAALAEKVGGGIKRLKLGDAEITVEGAVNGDSYSAALQSPATKSEKLPATHLKSVLDLFGYKASDLDDKIPPARIHGGADHVVIALRDRQKLADMDYDLDTGRTLMRETGLVTIMLVWTEADNLFHVRNAFASGGVLEDPATGAAAAAFAGYLRDIDWPHGGEIDIIQGEDMGSRSLLKAQFSNETASSVRISGMARKLK